MSRNSMEKHKTLHFDKHQCYNCKKCFLFAHALKEHTRNHSCNSLKFLAELPLNKEVNLKSRSVQTSDTLEPQCDQVLTNGVNALDKNCVLTRGSNRKNIFEMLSSVVNPEENCSDFEDHISLEHLKKCISSPKTINRAHNKNREHKTGTKSSKTNHSPDELLAYSINQNDMVKNYSKSTQSLLKLKEKLTKQKSSQIKKKLKLKIIKSQKTQLQKKKVSKKAGQAFINGDTFTSDKKKSLTEHAGELAQHCESPLVVRGTIKRTRKKQYINSSCSSSKVLENNSQMRNTISSDTESATSDLDSDYDKSNDKIPPQLIYINGRTYFNDQNPFVKKKIPQGKLSGSPFSQNSAEFTKVSTRPQAEKAGKASHLDFSGCHLCNIHCEDKTESQTNLKLLKEHVPYSYICFICGNSFLFKDSLKPHMETCHQICSSQDNLSKENAPQICKKHQQIIEIIDLALRSMLDPFQNKIDALNGKRKILDSNREKVVRCSPDTCIIVEDEDTEPHCDLTDLETSYVDLLKPYMRIYSDTELLALSTNDF
ncbi:unnamed protein product [Lymnaea stagnalis]|uniref:C2H2-type domain-containing protein n=1 Tax=Lymnaea stagnalis TaxID=6523 RepID=A0AAV2I910_LYMST